jgi:hypothetical protein
VQEHPQALKGILSSRDERQEFIVWREADSLHVLTHAVQVAVSDVNCVR